MDSSNVILEVNDVQISMTKKYFDPPMDLGNLSFNLNEKVTLRHLSTVYKILCGNQVLPMVDLLLYNDVSIVVDICDRIRVDPEKSFQQWVESTKCNMLPDIENMLALSKRGPYVNWTMFFNTEKPITRLLEKIRNRDDVIDQITFLQQFPYDSCFTENTDATQEIYRSLQVEKKALNSLIFQPGELTRVIESGEYHSNPDIAAICPVEYGETANVSKEVWKERFEAFTEGRLEDFDWNGVCCAGGSVVKLLQPGYTPRAARQSDVDFFIYGSTHASREKTLNRLLQYFSSADTYYAVRGSVISIYITGVNRKFQIISSIATNIPEVIGRFDLTHISWAWDGESIWGTVSAMNALRENITRYNNIDRIRSNRIVKAFYCGFSVETSEKIRNDILDSTELTKPDSEEVKDILQSFYEFYYPERRANLDPAEEKAYHIAMCAKDSGAAVVTTDISYAKKHIVISGDFSMSYDALSYKQFKVASVYNRAAPRRLQKVLLKSRTGAIRLTADNITITRTSGDESSFSIHVKIPADFADFITLLETAIYNIYRAGNVTQKNVKRENGEHVMRFTIDKHVMNAMLERGRSLLRDQRGVSLNIEEDLLPGDAVQIMFMIELFLTEDVRKVNIKPVKIIRKVNFEAEDEEEIPKVEPKKPSVVEYHDL